MACRLCGHQTSSRFCERCGAEMPATGGAAEPYSIAGISSSGGQVFVPVQVSVEPIGPPTLAKPRNPPVVLLAIVGVVLVLAVALIISSLNRGASGVAAPTLSSSNGGGLATGLASGVPATGAGQASSASVAGQFACPGSQPSGQLSDGFMTVTAPSGWELADAKGWTTCGGRYRQQVVSGWYSVVDMGIMPGQGRSAIDVAQAAWSWVLANDYKGSAGINASNSGVGATTVANRAGMQMLGQVLTPNSKSGLSGDQITIVVVQRPDGDFSVIRTESPLGRSDFAAAVAGVAQGARFAG